MAYDWDIYVQNKASAAGKSVDEIKSNLSAAGLTPEQHYSQYGRAEGITPYTAPSDFNEDVYIDNKSAAAGVTRSGFKSRLNALGISPLDHYVLYGKNEGISYLPNNGVGETGSFNTIGATDSSTPTISNPVSNSPSTTTTSSTAINQNKENKALPVTMPEVSLETTEPYVPSSGETVEGRLKGLLASESPYMQAAREKGERTAHDRGLLNSSLAAESSEKAAIEAALPIAQQDSQSLISTAADQNIVNTKAYQSAQLSSQEAAQQGILNQHQNQAASDISAQEAEQAANLSAQEAEQAAALEEMQQQGANYRQQVEMDFNDSMSMSELSTQEKQALSGSLEALGQSFQENMAGIQVNNEFSWETKTKLINDLQATYKANVDSLSSIYGVEVTWHGFDVLYRDHI